MGLGKVQESNGTFLSIAGGFIWDRKANKDHECYAEQDYEKADKTTGTRSGAQYGDLTGRVTKVQFRTHPEYGESVNVTFKDSEDEMYIVSISTGNRYSQDLMKALLVMDLEKTINLKPYDFTGADKKRAQGISFKQEGTKLDLKIELPKDYIKDEAWFKKAEKKQIKRYFEDLNDWFVSEVEEKVIPNIKNEEQDSEKPAPKKTEVKKEVKKTEPKEVKEEEVEEEEQVEEEETKIQKPSLLGMKKVIRPYIAENYPGKELPDLSPKDLEKWYDLVLLVEELPFEDFEDDKEETSEDDGQLSQEELDSQLEGLMED